VEKIASAALAMTSMHINYQPNSKLEKFGAKVFNLLVENFPQTFYVGGMVRDTLLHLKVADIDIATQATPLEVSNLLAEKNISHDNLFHRFGVVAAKKDSYKIEVATFRKDLAGESRYPKINFVKTAKQDSNRRDFTINALYLSPKDGKILDFHNGLEDLKLKKIRFIGNPEKRIKEDPLRIIRALRFKQTHNFKLETNTKTAIKNNFFLVKTLTKSKINKELNKIVSAKQRKVVSESIDKLKLA
jgi:tRNA nucleotidyltransferase/poly(A) polymerase